MKMGVGKRCMLLRAGYNRFLTRSNGVLALKNFTVLDSLSQDIGTGAVIYLASQCYSLASNHLIVPASML